MKAPLIPAVALADSLPPFRLVTEICSLALGAQCADRRTRHHRGSTIDIAPRGMTVFVRPLVILPDNRLGLGNG